MPKRILYTIAIAAALVLLTGCSGKVRYAENPVAGRETLFQVSTIDAVLNGVYDGVMPVSSILSYGDFGIGAGEQLDGELIILEGRAYQVRAEGVAYPALPEMNTPFASVTFFDIDREEKAPRGLDLNGLNQFIDSLLPSPNMFYAVRVEGTFSSLKTRSVPRQSKPYPPLVEVTKQQPTFQFNETEGTLIGFRSPPYVQGVNVTGYHLHYLTRDGRAGGHVLELITKDVVVKLDYTAQFLMALPGQGSDFYRLDLSKNLQQQLEKAEK